MMMIRSIDQHEILLKLSRPDNKPLFVEATDVRSFNQAHIQSAVLIPAAEVEKRAATYFPNRGAEIIVYGEAPGDASARSVATKLWAMGFFNVLLFEGGKREWLESGLTTQSGTPPIYPMLWNTLPDAVA